MLKSCAAYIRAIDSGYLHTISNNSDLVKLPLRRANIDHSRQKCYNFPDIRQTVVASFLIRQYLKH